MLVTTKGAVQQLKWGFANSVYAWVGADSRSAQVFFIAFNASDTASLLAWKRSMSRGLALAQFRGTSVTVYHDDASSEMISVLLAEPQSSAPPPPPPNGVNVGVGGGGTMFDPQISSTTPNLMFVSCDGTGLYRSNDGGLTWAVVDQRQAMGSGNQLGDQVTSPVHSNGVSVAFHPTDATKILSMRPYQGLVLSADSGLTWSAYLRTGAPSAISSGDVLAAAAFDLNNRLVVATSNSIHTHDASQWLPDYALQPNENVVRIVHIHDQNLFVAATDQRFLRFDNTQKTWAAASAPSLAAGDAIVGLAGASTPTGYVLFMTIANVNGTAVVYRFDSTTGNWTPAMGSGPAAGMWSSGALPSNAYYWNVAMPPSQPQLVYVTGYVPPLNAPFVWASTDGGGTWTGILDLTPASNSDVVDGWAEWDLNIGFGGAAKGFCIDPRNGQQAVFVNSSSLFATSQNSIAAGTPIAKDSVTWQQGYTRPVGSPAKGIAWSGNGLEVTTAWGYDVFNGNHFISYTDRGLAASIAPDGGNHWLDVHASLGWGNCYQVVGKPGSQTMWAAVARQNDIPLRGVPGKGGDGAILVSSDSGKTWSVAATLPLTGPTFPITSLAYGTLAGNATPALYAAVFANGTTSRGSVWQSTNDGATWTQLNDSFQSNQVCYRLVFDGLKRLYCIVDNVTGGAISNGTIYRLDSAGGSFTELASIGTARSFLGPNAAAFWPMDINAHGNFVYIGTYSSGGLPAKALQFDGNAGWADLKVPFNTAYKSFPAVFGVYFVDDTAFVTSDGNGAYSAPVSSLEPSIASPPWTEVPIPFLRTLRVSKIDDNNVAVTTFGNGAWKIPHP